jgi:C1A family cysteine protease
LLISALCLNVYSLAPEKAQIVGNILESQMDKSPKDLFKAWHLLFERKYTFDSEEAKQRFRIFKQNLAKIKETNAKNLSFKLGLNQFSDMSNEEFRSKYATLKASDRNLDEEFANSKQKFFLSDDEDDDLTKRNLQTYDPIDYSKWYKLPRDQGECGSCWAFTTASAVEGNQSKKLGQVINYLSPQQQVDCSTTNSGCLGGSLRNAMNYALQYGLENESDYTYRGYSQTCSYINTKPLTKISAWDYCCNYSMYTSRYCNFDRIYNLLSKGPLSVSTDGSTYEFQLYSSGIFTSSCYKVNHAVTLVGYGVATTGVKYYLVRNSWGTYWGENGYIRIAVNDANNSSCFIGYEAVLPIM